MIPISKMRKFVDDSTLSEAVKTENQVTFKMKLINSLSMESLKNDILNLVESVKDYVLDLM